MPAAGSDADARERKPEWFQTPEIAVCDPPLDYAHTSLGVSPTSDSNVAEPNRTASRHRPATRAAASGNARPFDDGVRLVQAHGTRHAGRAFRRASAHSAANAAVEAASPVTAGKATPFAPRVSSEPAVDDEAAASSAG